MSALKSLTIAAKGRLILYLALAIAFPVMLTEHFGVSEPATAGITFMIYLTGGLPLLMWELFRKRPVMTRPSQSRAVQPTNKPVSPCLRPVTPPPASIHIPNMGVNNPVSWFGELFSVQAARMRINGMECWIFYHGTPDINRAWNSVQEGLKPGPGKAYGVGVYMTASFDDAKQYSRETGVIFKLYIRTDTPLLHWDSIYGSTNAEKETWCQTYNTGLVYLQSNKWLIVHGTLGVPVMIPGLNKAELLNYYGNLIT